MENLIPLQIKSAGGYFIPDNQTPGVPLPPLGAPTANKLFVLKTGEFNEINFENVGTPGLKLEELQDDMSIYDSLKYGGRLAGDRSDPSKGMVSMLVPKPGTALFCGLELLALSCFRRQYS
ncbi:MAG: hypothetical protein P8N76_07450 [Pirellulaceae bacterium]|nr:hypothetical protein [Pirellulaceae bacterium]